MQMLSLGLPANGEGLSWIAKQTSTSLNWVPGVNEAHIMDAARGNEHTQAYLRQRAAEHAEVTAYLQNPSSTPMPACIREYALAAQRQAVAWSGNAAQGCQAGPRSYEGRRQATSEIVKAAASCGELAAMQWLRALSSLMPDPEYPEDETAPMRAAAYAGSLDMLKLLRSGTIPAPWGPDVITAAANQLDCLHWLLIQEPPCPCDFHNLCYMVQKGYLDGLECILAHSDLSQQVVNDDLMTWPAKGGQLRVMQWLHDSFPAIPLTERLCTTVAGRGDLSMLVYLRGLDPPCPWGELTCLAAIKKGHWEVLQWMLSQSPPCPMSSRALAAAVPYGISRLEFVRTFKPSVPWTAACCLWAAQHGNVPLLQWLRSQGCPLCAECAEAAVMIEDLPLLQYLHSEGCPLAEGLYYLAANYGQTEILQWLHQQDAPCPKDRLSFGDIGRHCSLGPVRVPHLMFLGDIGAWLSDERQSQLLQARRTYCTFHGLVRWSRCTSPDWLSMTNGMLEISNALSAGQLLLHRISMLPAELVKKIALAAGLQHDIL